jgi:glycosyltransferase involved in cell wall biosynthesis
MKTVLFYDPNLNERGTSVSVYDYAYYNEKILGNRSIIATTQTADLISFDKFNNQFETIVTPSINEIYNIKCDYFHVQKYGFNDGVIHPNAKNLIHVVFPSYEPHGDVYAYISKWLADTHGNGSSFVPYMVDLPNVDYNYKDEFKTSNRFVIGYYGGNNFEIPLARQAVIDAAIKRSDLLFLFMNQDPFCNLENVKFIKGTTNMEEKVSFINTCDAMIHARERGETFGLAIAEFSSKNKPIITYNGSQERNHLEILGDKAIRYNDYHSLYSILSIINHDAISGIEWNCYQEYTPENVIKQFNKIFLK